MEAGLRFGDETKIEIRLVFVLHVYVLACSSGYHIVFDQGSCPKLFLVSTWMGEQDQS